MYTEDVKPEIGDTVTCLPKSRFMLEGTIAKTEIRNDTKDQIHYIPQLWCLIDTEDSNIGLIWLSAQNIEFVERDLKTHIRIANKRT